MKVIVILPAAGLGTRIAAAAEKAGRKVTATKQFTEIAGAPIVIHTLRRFAAHPQVSEIYVALRRHESQAFHKSLTEEKQRVPVHVVEGGDSRQESVGKALAAVKADAGDVVLVHDAVRPFVDEEIITAVIEAAARTGAAIAGVPAVDTVKQVDRTAEGAIVTSTIPRERVVMAQTPQGFRHELIRQAFDDAQRVGFAGTDEASLVERIGHDVAVVMGSQRNIKITTPADLELAEFLFAHGSKSLAG